MNWIDEIRDIRVVRRVGAFNATFGLQNMNGRKIFFGNQKRLLIVGDSIRSERLLENRKALVNSESNKNIFHK